MCMGKPKTPKSPPPPAPPAPAVEQKEVPRVAFNEDEATGDAAAAKKKGRGALRIDRSATGGVQTRSGSGINIPTT